MNKAKLGISCSTSKKLLCMCINLVFNITAHLANTQQTLLQTIHVQLATVQELHAQAITNYMFVSNLSLTHITVNCLFNHIIMY